MPVDRILLQPTTQIPMGATTLISSVGGTAFGGVTPLCNVGNQESDFINRLLPPNFWNQLGTTLWIHVILTCPTNSNSLQLRGYVNGTLGYDSSSFKMHATPSAIWAEFQIMRVASNTLSVSTRVLDSERAITVPAGQIDLTGINFATPILLRLTGQGTASNQICYHNGWSSFFPPTPYLVI